MPPHATVSLIRQATEALESRRFAEAEQLAQAVLAAEPQHPEALHLLGVLHTQTGRPRSGAEFFRRSIAVNPTECSSHNNLGIALKQSGDMEAAIASYRRALELNPAMAEAFSNLGNALLILGRVEEATEACHQALLIDIEYADAWNNMGNCLQTQWRLEGAVGSYRQALRYRPTLAEAHNNLGNALKSLGQLDDAIACYREAIRVRPSYAEANSSLIYALLYHPHATARSIHAEELAWNQRHAAPLAASIQPHANHPDPERRLRIGYVSPNFRAHVISLFMAPLLKAHHRDRVEVFCYSSSFTTDAITSLLRGHADQWRDIAGMPDDQAAALIRDDGIDILVDVTMHMARSHLRLFARKPAPVQVTWLAYPGSTGVQAIDARLTDPHLDPPESFIEHGPQAIYSERTLWLPVTFWCYDPLTTEPAINPLPALANGHITFGCLNNFCKVNDGVLRLWAQVMKAVANSRLLLLASEGDHRRLTKEKLARLGIAEERIEFLSFCPRPEYLERYHQIDIGLETLPYNGHTTSLDSFWMGVPVVTLAGERIVGRAGVSQLTNLGLPELIARTPEEYVKIVGDLAGDLPRLAALRAGFRQRMERSPLMDANSFAGHLEAAYRTLWRQWAARAGGGAGGTAAGGGGQGEPAARGPQTH